MAYNFVLASSQTLNVASNPTGTTRPTFSAFARTNNTTDNKAILTVARSGTNFGSWCIEASSTSGTPVTAQQRGGALGVASSSAAYPSDDSWFHAAGVFFGTNDLLRYAYLNGENKGSNNTNAGAVTSPSRIIIGGHNNPTNFFDGGIAECAIWNVSLTDAEIASLGKGFKPTRIRPSRLVFYAPLIRDLQDFRGGLGITNTNGATVTDHPRVY